VTADRSTPLTAAVAALSLETEELAEREAEDAGAAETQEVAARELGVGVAEVGIEATGESDHGIFELRIGDFRFRRGGRRSRGGRGRRMGFLTANLR
jgi:hypothetical protein